MSDEQDQSRQPTPSGSGAGGGDRWGDPITSEREAELKALADRQRVWAVQPEASRGPSPMTGVRLSGADLFWLVTYALAGPLGDLAEARTRLLAAMKDPNAFESLDLSPLHLEGADLPAAHLADVALGAYALYEVDKHLGKTRADDADEATRSYGETKSRDAEEAASGTPAPVNAPPPSNAPPPPAPAAPPQQGWTLHEPPSEPVSANQSGAWPAQPPGAPPFAQPSQPSGTIAQPDEERVAFTSHYPREVTPKVWERLLVFIALDTPQAAAQVEAMAAERLRQRRDEFRAAAAPSSSGLRRGTRLTIVPNLPGMRADPASLTAEWVDDAQCYEFRVRADEARPGLAVNGFIEILEGPVLRGEIPLAIFVRGERQPAPDMGHDAVAHAAAYRHTFPSYARRDEAVVRAFETVVEASGDRFLRDVRTLRAGERWEPGLQALIEQADVFQLFWSQRAATSPQVEHEWRYALAHAGNRPNFIRPIYWTPQPYAVPAELQAINFARLDPAALALARTSWWNGIFKRG